MGPFSDQCRQSAWLLQSLSTILAVVYWSRVLDLNVTIHGGRSNETLQTQIRTAQSRDDFYCLVEDNAISVRPTMDANLVLCIFLSVQPTLVILLLVACIEANIGQGIWNNSALFWCA